MFTNKRTRKAGTEKLPADGRELREEFREAYRDHAGAVYAVAHGIGGVAVASEVTGEVFLRLWRQPEYFDPAKGSMRTSLLRATHRVAIDTIRPQVQGGSGARPPGVDPGHADQLAAATGERSVTAGPLDMLSDDEREAIVIVRYGGCTYREAAVALGLDEGTVKRRIRQGLHRLAVARPNPAPTT